MVGDVVSSGLAFRAMVDNYNTSERTRPTRADRRRGPGVRRIRYQEIADELRARARTAPAGSLLPSEAELSEEFGASRVTVRRALELVREDGLIAARQGFGWFVATEPVRAAARRPRHDRGPARRRRPGQRAPGHRVRLRGAAGQGGARCSASTQVLRVKRVNLADGEPFAVVTVWCPAALGRRPVTRRRRAPPVLRAACRRAARRHADDRRRHRRRRRRRAARRARGRAAAAVRARHHRRGRSPGARERARLPGSPHRVRGRAAATPCRRRCRAGCASSRSPATTDPSAARSRAARAPPAGSRCRWCRRSGNRPPWVTLSNGIPSSSATSRSPSFIRWMVVHADPMPRSRSASMKLHTAGSSDPHTGRADAYRGVVEAPPEAGDQQQRAAVEVVGEVRRRVGDLRLALAAGVPVGVRRAPARRGTRRSSCGRRRRSPASWRRRRPPPSATPGDCCRWAPAWRCEALLDDGPLDRPVEVEPLAHRAGGGEHLVGRQVQLHDRSRIYCRRR